MTDLEFEKKANYSIKRIKQITLLKIIYLLFICFICLIDDFNNFNIFVYFLILQITELENELDLINIKLRHIVLEDCLKARIENLEKECLK